jgi:hypothetical protein
MKKYKAILAFFALECRIKRRVSLAPGPPEATKPLILEPLSH